MRTLKLIDGDLDGDLDFSNGELQMVSDDEELKQSLEMILQIQLGEFFLDETIGLDRSNLLTKQLDEDQAQADIIEALMQDDRVEEVKDITFDIDKTNRTLSVSLTVVKTDGSSVSLEEVNLDA